MENKFTVIKNEDIKYLTKEQKAVLQGVKNTIAMGRLNENKNFNNTYAVVNLDEPYAKEIIEIMKRHGHWG